MEKLENSIHSLVLHQYEDGFKRVQDIDDLTQKILAEVRRFLDFDPQDSYNGERKRENYATFNGR